MFIVNDPVPFISMKLTKIGMSYESKKNGSKFYKTQLALQGVKLSQLISIFTSKNIWNFLIKIQQTKSNSKIIRR